MSDMRAVGRVIDNYISMKYGSQLVLGGTNFFE